MIEKVTGEALSKLMTAYQLLRSSRASSVETVRSALVADYHFALGYVEGTADALGCPTAQILSECREVAQFKPKS